MKTMSQILGVLAYACIGLFLYSFTPTQSLAACEPIYGGGLTCTDTSFTLETKVLNPQTNQFVPNLGVTDAKYHGNDTITFQITVTNSGSSVIQHTTIRDTLPAVVTFQDGPGQFNSYTNTLTFSVDNLPAHRSQVFTVTGRVETQNQFPSQVAFCRENAVSALPSSGTTQQASSQFCVSKVGNSPATGPEVLDILALIPLASAGFALQKFAKK